MVGGWSWWFCLFLCWSPPGAASTPSLRLPSQYSSVLRGGYIALTQAELCTPCRAAPGPPGCWERCFPALRSRSSVDAAAAWEGVVHSPGAAGSLHVPTKARFTNLSLRFWSVSKQPVACFWQWPGCVSWAIGKQSPSATPWAWAATHESSKDIANPPVAQGSSLGPSSWSSWRHLLFPTWSCLMWVWGWPVALDFGAWLLLGLHNILFYSQFNSLHN